MVMRITSIPRYIRIILVVAVLVIGEATLVLVLIAPAVNEIRALQQTVDARKNDLEMRYQRGTHLNALKTTYQNLNPEIEKWKKYFVDDTKILDVITELETLAGRSGVTKTIQLASTGSTPSAPGKADPYPLELTIDGPFGNVLQFMRSIERLPLFYSVDQWTLTSAPATITTNATTKGNVLVHLDGFLWKLK